MNIPPTIYFNSFNIPNVSAFTTTGLSTYTFNANPNTFIVSKSHADELKECERDVRNFARFIQVEDPKFGLSRLTPRNYQLGLLKRYQKNNLNIVRSTRQSGLSTMNAIYMLWYAIFNPNKTIVLCSGKIRFAKDQLDSIKEMYKTLPGHLRLKAGAVSFTKERIVFENKSAISIVSEEDPDSLRGYAISLLVLDNCAFYPIHNLREMFKLVLPSLKASNGKFIMSSGNHGTGLWTLFDEIWYDACRNESLFKAFDIKCHQVPGREVLNGKAI